MEFIEQLLTVLAWLQIFISPAIIGAIAATLIWLSLRGYWGVTLGAAVAAAGLVTGVFFAEKSRCNKGIIEFVSRTIAHPELREKSLPNDPRRIK